MTAKRLQQSKGPVHLNFSNKMQGGFTLLETMIAITILLIAVVGPISIIGDSLHKIYFARDQMIAVNLAQEGTEAVRQVRDTNMLSGGAWDNGFGTGECTGGGGVCLVDTNPAINIYKCTGACAVTNTVVYKSADGFYHQSLSGAPPGSTPTNFRRRIDTTKIPGSDEYKVDVNVTWSTGNIPGSITVSESIFKWAL